MTRPKRSPIVSSTATRSVSTWRWKRFAIAGDKKRRPSTNSGRQPKSVAFPTSCGPIWKRLSDRRLAEERRGIGPAAAHEFGSPQRRRFSVGPGPLCSRTRVTWARHIAACVAEVFLYARTDHLNRSEQRKRSNWPPERRRGGWPFFASCDSSILQAGVFCTKPAADLALSRKPRSHLLWLKRRNPLFDSGLRQKRNHSSWE